MMCIRVLLAAVWLLIFTELLTAAAPPSGLPELTGPDVDMLREAGLKADEASLLDFFRRRAPSPAEMKRLSELIDQLGADTFDVREKAGLALDEAGVAAASLLRRATASRNAQVARAARLHLARLTKLTNPVLSEAAARLLALRRPGAAVPVLLAYLPFAEDDGVEGEVRGALASVQRDCGSLDPSLLAALKAPHPARRAGAAHALGEWRGTVPCGPLLPLLKDPVVQVRLRAALALIKGGEKGAVAELLAQLGEAPLPLAWEAERMLCRVAGASAPAVALQGTPASRRQSRDAWVAWWRTHALQLELVGQNLRDPADPLVIFTELDEGRVVALGPDWKERWAVTDLEGPADVQVLPSGRLLIAENHGGRITERTRNGKVVWQIKGPAYPLSCWRLDNGNTFIASNKELRVVAPDGKGVWRKEWPHGVRCARRLRDGRIVLLANDKGGFLQDIVTLSPNGEQLNRIENVGHQPGWASLSVLPNGHFLVVREHPSISVLELDSNGLTVRNHPMFRGGSAIRLPNGHTLIADVHRQALVEVDQTGKVIRQQKTEGRPWHVQLLP